MSSFVLHRRSGRLPQSTTEPTLPALFVAAYGLYRTRRSSFVLSFLGHTAVVAVLLISGRVMATHRREIRQQVTGIVTEVSPYILPPSACEAGGGGGGGDRDKLQASKGTLPRFSREQLAPPAVVIHNENPKLPVEPTVVVPPEIHLSLPQTGPLGDPFSSILGPPSSGTGSGGGIGSGSGGGVGSGRGARLGRWNRGWILPRWRRSYSPRVIYAPDPEFSEEARKAKFQGTVVLWLIVGTDGRTHAIHVERSLGMGLDEKAIEVIRQWRFEPGRKDGIAVAVQVSVEVNFQLY